MRVGEQRRREGFIGRKAMRDYNNRELGRYAGAC
uniref:Uncharacterized protein n=1 Tax=Nelumbo nucifera TaxID=4432 RepID=A0A822YTA0_NELNU|nr:TPA_asm: hypothetical protein HUJ06_005973 [Nelumbo nucifera]